MRAAANNCTLQTVVLPTLCPPEGYAAFGTVRTCISADGSIRLSMATNWIDPSDELPPESVYVEAQTELGIIRARYCGPDNWRAQSGEWITAPLCWRFGPPDPLPSTGHFMLPRSEEK